MSPLPAHTEECNLSGQFDTHFIYNVLNAIESCIMGGDTPTAQRLIQQFATWHRVAVLTLPRAVVTLQQEWLSLKLYATLEELRFGRKLVSGFTLEKGIDLGRIHVQSMSLQSLLSLAIQRQMKDASRKSNLIAVAITWQDGYICLVTGSTRHCLEILTSPICSKQ
ncbi:LytS/YehU family sensor histidine kinase [Algoriphagus sp. 4150]|uniref:histidine kinase n=1 Tax=Algoriphagus sp. 4150 TaxID=2817756 RepID=UPI002864F94C|nr:histidine kinase [Algoriphagus sp. 4150]MDR7131809.1 LytS/YehU family sensor histidine kinase [Algoriphagus sp. 4150]